MTTVEAVPAPAGPARRQALGSRGRRVGWAAIVAAAIGLLVVAGVDRGGAETDAERIQRLDDSFACPQCQGESVADSSAAVAATIRQFIADQVSAGATDQQIRDQLVASYQGKVLRNAPAQGFGSLVWVLPVVGVVAGAAGVAAMVGRRQPTPHAVSDDDRELVERARRALSQGALNGTDGPDGVADGS